MQTNEWDLTGFEGATVAVAVPDATRPIDWSTTLRPLLARLDPIAEAVHVEVALGLHRLMTEAELAPLSEVCGSFDVPIHQHDPQAHPGYAPRLAQADRIVCVGVVEPHQYAGFSGGIKTVAIGCASAQQITHMHRVELLRDARVTLGRYHDNPFQDALWRAAESLPPCHGLYLVPDATGPDQVYFGPARAAMERAVVASRADHFWVIDEPVDWLHLVVPSVKAQNVYQASRAATYAGLVERPALVDGGLLIVDAAAPEGMGDGRGERACARAMLRGADALRAELKSDEPIDAPGGAQRAYVIAKTLARFQMAFVGIRQRLPELEAMGIAQFDTMESAVKAMCASGAKGLRVDHPFHRVPVAGT